MAPLQERKPGSTAPSKLFHAAGGRVRMSGAGLAMMAAGELDRSPIVVDELRSHGRKSCDALFSGDPHFAC